MSSPRRTFGYLALGLTLAPLSPLTLEAQYVEGTHRHRGTATIDGVEGEGEWTGALVGYFPMDLPHHFHTPPSEVPIFVMNDDSHLYVAARIEYDESPSYPYFLFFSVEAWVGTLTCTGYDIPDHIVIFSVDDLVTVRDEHLLICEDAYQDNWTATGTLDTEGAWAISDGTTFFEMAQPLDSADDLHDLNSAPSQRISLNMTAGGGYDLGFDYGLVASAVVNVFLVSSDTLLYADFEVGDTSEWSSPEP